MARVIRLLAWRSARAVIHVSYCAVSIWDDPDLRPVSKPVGAVNHDRIAGLQPGCDLDPIAVGDARLDFLNADRIRLA